MRGLGPCGNGGDRGERSAETCSEGGAAGFADGLDVGRRRKERRRPAVQVLSL